MKPNFLKFVACLVSILLSSLSFDAIGASFDCSKARSKMEKAICSNNELGMLDEYLAISFGDVKNFFSKTFFIKYIKTSQLSWLKETSWSFEQSNEIEFLIRSYQERIKILVDSKKYKFGFKVFEGKIDTKNKTIIQLQSDDPNNYFYISLTPLSKDLIFVSDFYQKPSLPDDIRPRCERNNRVYRLSKAKELQSGDLFEPSYLSSIAAAIYANNKTVLTQKNKNETIEDIVIDLRSLSNILMDETTLTIDYKFGGFFHSCATAEISIKISEIKKYLNKDFAKELGF